MVVRSVGVRARRLFLGRVRLESVLNEFRMRGLVIDRRLSTGLSFLGKKCCMYICMYVWGVIARRQRTSDTWASRKGR